MYNSYFNLLILILAVSCKTGELKILYSIPSNLTEVSAIEYTASSNIAWTIEDSGNSNIIYGLNKNGNIIKSLKVDNAKNIDWEDLTTDKNGNLYIGDFGDNYRKRKKYTIYKINAIDSITANNTEASVIDFQLPEGVKSKDFEAFFIWNDFFYLFSKSNKNTMLFKVPNSPGEHNAIYISSINLHGKHTKITSADISENGKTVVLLNHDKIWKLTDFKLDNLFSGKLESIKFDHDSQKEGVSFKNKNTLYITDEKVANKNAYLYSFDLN